MRDRRRELMKHELETPAPTGRPVPPPLAEGPDMGDTVRLFEKISRMPDIRFEKVQRMRELIARGEFETPERIDGTVRRLMEELGL